MAPGSGSDPLAELARLIGQNDPFSEFGRDSARRVAAPHPGELPADWDARPAEAEYAHPPDVRAAAPHAGANNYYAAAPTHAVQAPIADTQSYGAQNYGRQPFGGPQQAAGGIASRRRARHPCLPAAKPDPTTRTSQAAWAMRTFTTTSRRRAAASASWRLPACLRWR
jgi:hypothetical protein